MMVQCPKGGEWHDCSPTALAVIVGAFTDGDMQVVTPKGVRFRCLLEALTDERIERYRQKYPGNTIRVKDAA